MNALELRSLKAFLVALAKTSSSESVPKVDSTILQQPTLTIDQLQEQGGEEELREFWQKYQQSRQHFHQSYQAKPKNKVIRPSQPFEDSSPRANDEEENISLAASEVEESFQHLDELRDILDSEKPTQKAKQSYQKYLQDTSETENKNYYTWAVYLCSQLY